MVPSKSMDCPSKIRCSGNSTQQLLACGYCHIHGNQFELPDGMWNDFDDVKRHFDNLPRDPYGPNANRFRQLRRYTFLPYGGNILLPRPDDASLYEASYSLNPEVVGVVRQY